MCYFVIFTASTDTDVVVVACVKNIKWQSTIKNFLVFAIYPVL